METTYMNHSFCITCSFKCQIFFPVEIWNFCTHFTLVNETEYETRIQLQLLAEVI